MAAHNASGTPLSGHAYITVRIRGEASNRYLRVVAPRNCNHGGQDEGDGTVCETAECLNSWSLDYQFFLRRTARGRAIIERFMLPNEVIRLLELETSRPIATHHDPFDKAHDKT